MNIKQAKAIPIDHYLSQKGHVPTRRSTGQLWYCSPLRQESVASFKVNLERNQWYDFGLGAGGDLLDLVKGLEGVQSVSEVLSSLSSVFESPPVHAISPATRRAPSPAPISTVVSASEVRSPSLVRYLEGRGLQPAALPEQLREVHYRRGDKNYFGLGIANDAGGFEIRSSQFKGTVGPKAISTISGTGDSVLLFEGLIDYLTASQTRTGPMPTCIILNSVAMVQQAIAKIQNLGVSRVDVYRDNDASGECMLESLQTALPEVHITDMAQQYTPFKDLNDWFTNKLSTLVSQKPSSRQL